MKMGGKMTHEYLTSKSEYVHVNINTICVDVMTCVFDVEIHRTPEILGSPSHWTDFCQSDSPHRPRSGWPEAMWVWSCARTEDAVAMGKAAG